MPRIFDNLSTETQLLGGLRDALHGAVRADFCVGYFNLRGWSRLGSYIEQLESGTSPVCRVLVGMQRPGREEVERAFGFDQPPELRDQQTITRLKRQMAEEFREQITIGRATNESEAGLRRLRRQILDGKVQIKLFLSHPLHAKLYLVHRTDSVTPRIGFLGSSNLTFSGLSNQGELNIDVPDQDAADKLQRWFNDRWCDRWCLDISEDLVKIIEESWAREELVQPYHVYLKMVYHLSQEARAGLSEFKIPRDFGAELFEFQKAAVKIAAHHVYKRRGVIIGDVVGLGKTLMATALARVLQDDLGFETLIICPPKLEPMWQDHIEKHRLIAKIVPMSRVIEELPELRLYRVVLIDESHNFRNPEGMRYRAIRDYVQRNDSRVILLSATPYNKAYLDLSAQLRLFVPEDEDIGIRPEALLRTIGETRFLQQHQCGLRTLRAFEKSEEPDDWRNLMRRYLVRRTRGFVQEHYAERDEHGRPYLLLDDGRQFPFPKRIPKTVAFAFDRTSDDPYPRLFSPEVVDAIDTLRLPRYGLGNYLDVGPSVRLAPAERDVIRNLGRAGVRLIGFSRTNLFKRLESGGPAFLQSVDRHILRNFVFVHALENGLELPIGTQDVSDFDTQFADADEFDEGIEVEGVRFEADYRRLAAQLYDRFSTTERKRFKWLRADVFGRELVVDLLHDARELIAVLEQCGRWIPARDTKLHALADLLLHEHPSEKVLVFTQFADTARYLNDQLQCLGVTAVEGVTAASSDPTRSAWRFSPRSNDKVALAEREGELRVLVATDVLSEGQNLQDASIIVNYDLPWAIIRLIQRAGRIDRIGQDSPEILCYSFMPADGLEQVLNLRGRLRNRLRQNAEVVGTDEAFFEDDVDERPLLVNLYNEKAGILDDTEDLGVDPTSEAYQLWKDAIQGNPKLQKIVEELPDVVYATRAHEATTHAPNGVLVFVRTPDGNDALAWVNERGEIVSESTLDVLRAATCDPWTPALPRSEAHHELVNQGVQHILTEQSAVGGQLGRTSGARYRAYHLLREYADSLTGKLLPYDAPNLDALKLVIQDIHDYPLRNTATDRLNRLLRSGASPAEIARATIELRDNDLLSIPAESTETREPKIICSMGLARTA
jgi:superfamily II DNA or RNA helicase